MATSERRKAALKGALYEAIAVMGKAFASPRRLELIDLLAQGPRNVDQLARASKQSVANTSQHLQGLHAAGVVNRERDGSQVRYELAGEEVLRLWLALRDTSAERLAQVERSARDYLGEEVEAIDRKELVARMRRGEIELVDVRPPEEFAAGHIEGARSIPLDELEQHLESLPSEREVIAYCRGPHCVLAQDAVRRMQAAGLRARKLEEGWPEWRLSESKPTADVSG